MLIPAPKVSKAVKTVILMYFRENRPVAKILSPSLFLPPLSLSALSPSLHTEVCNDLVHLNNLLCTSRCPEIISMQTPREGKHKVIQFISASTMYCKEEFLSLNAHWQLIFSFFFKPVNLTSAPQLPNWEKHGAVPP